MPFADIIGHEREIEVLKRGILNNRVPHAFIFAGPSGVGKRTTAVAFAKALNCNRLSGDFCDECPDCLAIDNSLFVDVFLIEPKEPEYKGGAVDHVSGTIREEDITYIQQRLGYSSDKGNKKVSIIDGADKMNRFAQNKLLKTLEEPPLNSVIILISAHYTSLIPTVLSRCRRINFRPVRKDIISQYISDRLNISSGDADIIASLSSGSIGTALGMDREWTLNGRKQLIERFERLSIKNGDDILRFAEEVSKEEDIGDALEFLKIWYRDIALYLKGMGDMVINLDMLPFIKKHAQVFSFEKVFTGFTAIIEAQKDIAPPR